ncbi:MAG: hypothetical protein SGI84_02370 [Gemmatimonadota bacterium]|nr:hypothetical protein [Gemmatimonadota bacterium]
MSRAFTKEDADGPSPQDRYRLPPPEDPGFEEAVARALLQGANEGDSMGAEEATGYLWGDKRLVLIVTRIRDDAERMEDDRMESLANRFLREAARG